MKVDPVLQERLTSLITSMGYELIGCELISQAQRAVFRIYIDRSNGVTVEDCSRVSHQVGAMMDVLNTMQGKYLLEVSSPGIDRPLFKLEHYTNYVGSKVNIRLYTPLDGRRQYQGVLKRVEKDNIYLWVDDIKQEVILPFSAIEKANVVGEVHI